MKHPVFSNKATVLALAILVSILWGTLFPTIKIGYQAFDIDSAEVASILLFAGVRFLISGMLLIAAEGAKKRKIALPNKAQIKAVLIVSVLTVVLHYAFTYAGLSLAESSKSSVLKQVGFLIVPGIAFLFRKQDRCSVQKILAAILGFLSVIVINLEGMNLDFEIGEILVIVASFCSMFGQILSKNIYDRYEPTFIIAYAQFFGGIVLTLAGVLFGGSMGRLTLQSVAVLGYICFASIAANVLWNTLIKYNDMSRLAVLKSMDPLFASLFSALFLGENIWKPTYLAAVALIIVAVAVSNYNEKKPRRTSRLEKKIHKGEKR